MEVHTGGGSSRSRRHPTSPGDEETKQERGGAAAVGGATGERAGFGAGATAKHQTQQQQQPPVQVALASLHPDAGATLLAVDPHDLLSVEIPPPLPHPDAPSTAAATAAAAMGAAAATDGDGPAPYVRLADLRFPYFYSEALLSTQAMASTSSLEGGSVHSLDAQLEPALSLTSLADTSSVGDMSDMASLRMDPLDPSTGHGNNGQGDGSGGNGNGPLPRLFYGRDGAPLYSQVKGVDGAVVVVW